MEVGKVLRKQSRLWILMVASEYWFRLSRLDKKVIV